MSTEPSEVSFDELGLSDAILETLGILGYERPTPIQRQAIPVLLAGRDVLGQAATGTGKTAAFALPLLQHLAASEPRREPRALVVVPTRELAMQVSKAIRRYAHRSARILAAFGGTPLFHQIRTLEHGTDVVVVTPGRAVDLVKRGFLDLGHVEVAILDEADEMLDLGFQEELEALWEQLPPERQTALFSATFPHRLKQVARDLLREPERIVAEANAPGEKPQVEQRGYLVAPFHKRAALARILDMEQPTAALVFCRTRDEVDSLTLNLAQRGFRAEALHGGRSQSERDRVMERLRAGACDLVVATDVAARGIDIGHLTHVVNVNVPDVAEQYVHRIGRTGRAGREGTAITLVEPRERHRMRNIEDLTGDIVELEPVPSLDDLASRRLEILADRVKAFVEEAELDELRELVTSLELDPLDVAAAALKALHDKVWEGEDDEEDIPAYAQDRRRERRARQSAPGAERRPPPPEDGWAAIYVGMGKSQRLRPGDLFGALLNETPLQRGQVGSIEVSSQYAIVQVPEPIVYEVIDALRATSIRGRRPVIRRDKYAHKPRR